MEPHKDFLSTSLQERMSESHTTEGLNYVESRSSGTVVGSLRYAICYTATF